MYELNEIKSLIAENKLEESLFHIEKLPLSINHKRGITTLKTRLSSIYYDYSKGIISLSESNIKTNRLIADLLQLIDNLNNPSWILNNENEDIKYPHFLTLNVPINIEEIVIGREDELINIRETISQKGIVVLKGIGGIGKTTIVREYVRKNHTSFLSIIWIRISDISGGLLGNVVSTFGNDEILFSNLRLEFNPKVDVEIRFSKVINALQNLKGPNLLIIDNANSSIEKNIHKLPKGQNWQTLISSRQKIRNIPTIEIGQLTLNSAVELFKIHFYGRFNLTELKELIKYVGCHPLSIEMVAKVLDINNSLKIVDAFELIKRGNLNSSELNFPIGVLHNLNGEEVEIYQYLISLFDISSLNKNEKDLLTVFSYLPSRPIEGETLRRMLCLEKEDSLVYWITINSLSVKGFLTRIKSTYSCHSLIQEVSRFVLNLEITSIDSVLKFLIDHLSNDAGYDVSLGKKWLEFTEVLLSRIQSPNYLSVKLRNQFGWYLKDFAEFEKAIIELEKCLKSAVSLGFPELECSIRNNLGVAYHLSGNLAKAQENLTISLRSWIQFHGSQHPEISLTKDNLAKVLHDLGEFNKAKEMMLEALEFDLKTFGLSHPKVALRKNNLGFIHYGLGEFELAKLNFEAALKSHLENLGTDHHEVATSRGNLGATYFRLDDLTKAKHYLKLALKSDINNFGEYHPNVAIRLYHLGNLALAENKQTKALGFFKQSLKIRNKIFGKDHSDTRISATRVKQLEEQDK